MVDEEGNESSQELHFFYDSQSKPAFVEFEGECYRYIHSLQGDIIAIVDSAGSTVVEYKYDAWGRVLSIVGTLKDSLGHSNPFRYRSNVLDNESAMYYLEKRYYLTGYGRFLNADTLLFYERILGGNQYAYCYNTPVVFADKNGMAPKIIPQPSRPLDWDKDYVSDPRNQPIAVDRPKNKKTSFVSKIFSYIKKLVGSARYNEVDRNHRGGNSAVGYVVGQSVSHQAVNNSSFITGYTKTINDCRNLGLSIGGTSIEIGESGITLAQEVGPNSVYINLSDELYIGLSTTVTKDNNAITSYGELYVDLPTLAFAAVAVGFGGGLMPAYSSGIVF